MQEKILWNADSDLLIHVPHSSVRIPDSARPSFVIPDVEAEQLKMTDRYTDDLFDHGDSMIVFPVSRLVCDVERFRRDQDEPMAAVGMGLAYTARADRGPLKTVTEEDRRRVLEEYYDPHHRLFTDMVRLKLKDFGSCLIVDGHSFSARPLPYESDPARPDFCLGADPFHTPPDLVRAMADLIEARGCRVGINAPFAGTIVPMKYYRRDRRVASVMIEINRGLYMDDQGRKRPGYAAVKEVTGALLDGLRSGWRRAE
jgi:N-formylglutamate deformylase